MKENDKNESKNKKKESVQYEDTQSYKDKINLDYDWNTEYGDGDIPDIDK